MMKVGE